MTRKDLSLILIAACFINLSLQPSYVSLVAFVSSALAVLLLELSPVLFDKKSDQLRADLSRELASQAAEIETLKNKVDSILLGRR